MITAETIDRIARFDSHGLPVVSVYVEVPVDPGDRRNLRGRTVGLLQQIESLERGDGLDHDAQMSVRGDLTRIREAVATDEFDSRGVAFFSCSGADLFEEVTLPRPIHDRVMVDETPWVRPMLAVLDEYHRCGVVVVDTRSAQVWELYQDELREEERVRDKNLRKDNLAGGWQGYREWPVRNRAAELSLRHFRHVADVLANLDRSRRYDVIVVGGHEPEIPLFLDRLPRHLREKVIGTFDVDPNTADRGVIREQAGRLLEEYERDQERRQVADVFERAAEGRPAAIGLRDTLWAGSMSAIHHLLVEENAIEPGTVCGNCGWLGLGGEGCPVCGSALRHTPDVIDELVQAVIDESGTVEHVQADTRLREHVVAAVLRFPLPPQPDAVTGER
jgi:peptide subunit release factor 1 (eRF1)